MKVCSSGLSNRITSLARLSRDLHRIVSWRGRVRVLHEGKLFLDVTTTQTQSWVAVVSFLVTQYDVKRVTILCKQPSPSKNKWQGPKGSPDMGYWDILPRIYNHQSKIIYTITSFGSGKL